MPRHRLLVRPPRILRSSEETRGNLLFFIDIQI